MVTRISLPSKKHAIANSHALIYFICGNPGLIEYYTTFLDSLRSLLDETESHTSHVSTAYDIYGRDLLGFGAEQDEAEPFSEENPPFDLEAQINGMWDDLSLRRTRNDDGTEPPYDHVILMGHSVGTFIGLEIFHRHAQDPSRAPHLHLRHGLLLFPTISDLAASPSGYRLSLLQQIPLLERNAHRCASFLLSWLSPASTRRIVSSVLGFSPEAADVTSRWLASRDGVRQALYLGMSELRQITDDKWGDELWEGTKKDHVDRSESNSSSNAGESKSCKFYLYYAKDDHWIANSVRDQFIARRREHGLRAGGSARIEVDEGGVKHAFCTEQSSSRLIAGKVHSWIEEIEGCHVTGR